MKSEFNMKNRYYEILSICNITVEEFSNKLGIESKIFSRHADSSHITAHHAKIINKMGINVLWLLFGEEPKYNKTHKGYELRKLFKENEKDEVNFIYYKIKEWIEIHYDSIEDFEIIFELKEEDSVKYVKNTNQLPYKLSRILNDEGMNTYWLYHSSEEPYNNRKTGKSKREWVLEFLDEENYIFNNLKR